MRRDELMNWLHQELDYSGGITEVLARIPDAVIEAFADALDVQDTMPHLYFGLRRYAVELGTPDHVDIRPETGRRTLNIAPRLLVMERMRRKGEITVTFPREAFTEAGQREEMAIAVTELGRRRKRELERREQMERRV
jgi:hypothetical protein